MWLPGVGEHLETIGCQPTVRDALLAPELTPQARGAEHLNRCRVSSHEAAVPQEMAAAQLQPTVRLRRQ